MPSRCSLPIPAFVQTLDPSGRRAHWLSQAERHGLDLQLERAVGPAELPAHVPASVLSATKPPWERSIFSSGYGF